jgi:hypothetical protein
MDQDYPNLNAASAAIVANVLRAIANALTTSAAEIERAVAEDHHSAPKASQHNDAYDL